MISVNSIPSGLGQEMRGNSSSPRVLEKNLFGDSKGLCPFVMRGNSSSPRVLEKNLFGDSKGLCPFVK